MATACLATLLADLKERFHLLTYGLAMVLVFVGTKMLIVDFYKIPVGLSLGIVGLIIASFMFATLPYRSGNSLYAEPRLNANTIRYWRE